MVIVYGLGAILLILALDELVSKIFARPFWFVITAIDRVVGVFVKPEPKPPVTKKQWPSYDPNIYGAGFYTEDGEYIP